MKVKFENVLVCDVVDNTYENKTYYKMIVYQDRQLYQLSIDENIVSDCKGLIGKYTDFETEMKIYDGKNKFSVIF